MTNNPSETPNLELTELENKFLIFIKLMGDAAAGHQPNPELMRKLLNATDEELNAAADRLMELGMLGCGGTAH